VPFHLLDTLPVVHARWCYTQDPGSDFRATGMLGLKNLLYFCEAHPDVARRLAAAGRTLPQRHFPFAITAINASRWLLDGMGLLQV
jgi:hypothetical protein